MSGTKNVENADTPYDPWRFPSAPTSVVDNPTRAQPERGFHGSEEEFRKVTLGIFNEAGLLQHFRISEERAIRFFDRVYKLYGDNPYHCALHGQDVLISAHCLMTQLRELNHGPFTELDVLGLYTGKGPFFVSLSLFSFLANLKPQPRSHVLGPGTPLCPPQLPQSRKRRRRDGNH